MHYTLGVYTLGCKVSQYESEAIFEEGLRRGFCASEDEIADVYVINTCTVTAEGDRKCRQLIRRLRGKNADAKILVCGCYSQVSPSEVAKLEVDYICGTANKLAVIDRAISLLDGDEIPRIEVSELDGASFEKMSITHAPRTRAYVKIEDGCENRCAYCKIPEARGLVRSKTVADTVNEVKALASSGVLEVVLTGIETASFGADTGESLIDLLRAVDGVEGIRRIRLGSLEPTLMKSGFVDGIATIEKLTPHFHLSIQSGSSAVLAAMKRKYNADTALKNIEYIKSKIFGVRFTTDFIVGFPGETEENFNETLDFARKAEFLATHVFKYSKRTGTAAATMANQVSETVKQERSGRLIELSAASTQNVLKDEILIRPETTVLFEQREDGLWSGHTASFAEVRVKYDGDLHGKLLPVRLLEAKKGYISGEVK